MSTNKTATIRLLDEVNIAVIGLRQEEYKVLSNKFAVHAKNYVFHPLFKLKKWDGKIRFFSQAGASYFNLLDEIIPIVKSMGYTIKYIDNRKYQDVQIPKINADYLSEWGITLGSHQVNAVNAIVENGNGVLIAGTGAGKTFMTAIFCDLFESRLGFKTIIIVPTIDLIDQTAAELRTVDLVVGTYSGVNKSMKENIIVSTWQALQNNPKILSQFQAIIVDECHGVTGKVLQDLLNVHGAHVPIRIGMTGTLPKDKVDRMAVRICLGKVLYVVEAADLIESGWLAGVYIKMYCLLENFKDRWMVFCKEFPEEAAKIDENEFVDRLIPDFDAETTYLRKRTVRTTFIADFIETLRIQEKGNTFVLVKGIPFGKKLAKMIDGAMFVYGQDETAVRKQIYKLFEEHNNLVVISTFQLASTGLNIKRIFNLVFVDAGKSFTKIIQAIGRGLRKAVDKDFVNVYDFYSNLKYSKRHAGMRKSYYKEQRYDHEVKKVDYEAYYK
jgi:superfamily II DNA or RNA helicase